MKTEKEIRIKRDLLKALLDNKEELEEIFIPVAKHRQIFLKIKLLDWVLNEEEDLKHER